MPVSHQAAIRRAVRSEVNRERADGARSSRPINVATLCVNGFSARAGRSRALSGPELGAYFNRREEKGDLPSGILKRVGPVHRIRLDRLGEILTNCAG